MLYLCYKKYVILQTDYLGIHLESPCTRVLIASVIEKAKRRG